MNSLFVSWRGHLNDSFSECFVEARAWAQDGGPGPETGAQARDTGPGPGPARGSLEGKGAKMIACFSGEIQQMRERGKGDPHNIRSLRTKKWPGGREPLRHSRPHP